MQERYNEYEIQFFLVKRLLYYQYPWIQTGQRKTIIEGFFWFWIRISEAWVFAGMYELRPSNGGTSKKPPPEGGKEVWREQGPKIVNT